MEENVIGMPDSFFERLNKKNGFADDTTAAPVDSGTTPVATDKTIPSGMPDSFFEKLNSQQHYADTNNWAENYKRYIPQAEENPSAWDNIKNNFFAIKDASEASMYGGLELMSRQGEKSGNANFANFIKAAGMYYGADPNWLVKNMQENEAQSQEELKRVWLDPKMGQFNATDMFADPKSFFQTQLPQMLGGSATLMAAGMGIAKGVQTGVMALGAAGAPFTFGGSAVAAGFIGGAVASAISRPIESLMEGYGAFDEAYSELAKKYPNATHQQLTDMAMPVFNKTFDENMQLQVLDAVQLGLSIIPVTAWGKGALSGTGAIGRMARRADMMRQRYNVAAHIGETAFQMGTEGWEEGRQMQITNEAINKYVGTDKPTSWYDMLNTKEGQSAVSGGAFMGGMMESPGILKLAYNKLTGVGDDIKTKPYEDIKQKQTALFYGNIAKSVNEGTTNEMMQAINKFGRSGVLATVETDDADSRNKSSIAEAKRLGDEVAEQVGVFSRMKEQYPDVSEKGLVRMFQNNALIRNNANALKTLSEDNVTDAPIIQRINAQNEALNKENNDIIAGKDVWETPSHEDPFADPEKDKEADIPFDSVEEVEAARLKEIEALQQIPTDGMTDEQMHQRAESLAEINSRYEDLKNRLTEKINDAKGHYENQRVLTEMLQNNIPVEGTIQKAYGMHYDFVTQDGKTVRFYNQATHDVVDDNDFNGSAFLVLRKAEQGLDGTYKDEKGNYLFRSVLGDKDHAERIEVHTTDKDGNDKYLGNVAVSNAEDYNIARDRAKAARMEKLEGEDGEGEGFSVSDEQLSGVKTTSNEQAAEAQSYGFRNAYHALNSVNKYFDADYTDYANIPKEDLALVGRIKQEEAASATTTTPPPDSPPDSPPPSEPDTPPAPPTPPPTPPPAPQSPSPASAPSGTTSSTDSGNAGYERTERSFDKVNVGDNITHNGKQGKVFAKVRPKGSLSHPVVLAKDAEGVVFRVSESEYKGTERGESDNVLKTNGKLLSYRNDIGRIVVDEENNVIFEGNKSSVELGKTTDEEFAAKSIGDIGISYVNENSLDQAILVDNTVYIKGEQQELVRINYDKNDNVVSYTYKNSKGHERTNRNSETALDIAIQKNNQEFDKSRKGVSDEVKQRDEEHISGVVKSEYGDSIGYILETMPDEVYDTFGLMEAGVTRLEKDAVQDMVLRTLEALADARKRIEGSNATKKEKGSALSMIEKFEKDLNKYYGKLDQQGKVSAKDVAKANTGENNKGVNTVQDAEQKTEAYHADKAAGKETELVKAVEGLLGKKEEVKTEKKVEKPAEQKQEQQTEQKQETKPDQKPTIEQQVKTFGVADKLVKPVTEVANALFSGLKKVGLVAKESVEDWLHIGKADKVDENSLDGFIESVKKELPKVEKKESKIQSWIDKWNELKKQKDLKELDLFYNKVKVALNGYAQGKGVETEFKELKKDIEDYAEKLKQEQEPKISSTTEFDTKKQPINKLEDLQDVGEKIGGAKKDLAQALSEVTSEDIKSQPLSKVFPKPDFDKLISEKGISKDVAILLNYLYSKIPSKPRKPYQVSRWVDKVNEVIDIYRNILEEEGGSRFAERVIDGLRKSSTFQRDYNIYSAIINQLGFGFNPGTLEIKEFSRADDGKKTFSIVNGRFIVKDFDTLEDAVNGLGQIVDAKKDKPKETKFDIYQDTKTKEYFIGKKGATGVNRIAEGFKTLKEARDFLKTNQEQLQETWDALRDIPTERRKENRDRKGIDWRKGKNVDAEEFRNTFGFRGVEFGNWVNNAERQAHVNEAYDALMDLASVLGISPKALSLNGELGFAFGARGSGKFNAHYEAGKVVINLTKTRGAGSLAHEWWHALDNYFSRARNQKTGFITERPRDLINRDGSRVEGVRKEMIDAFKSVMDAISGSKLKDRSEVLDKTRSEAYWSTPIEMSARSFENYIIEKLGERNQQNDYLANFKETTEWINDTKGDIDALKNYPYPLAEESPIVNEKFQQFFETIKEDESGKLFKDDAVEKSLTDIQSGKTFYEVVKENDLTDEQSTELAKELAESKTLPKKQFSKKDKIANDFDPNDNIDVKPIDKPIKTGKSKVESILPIAAQDDLRPVLSSVYFDNGNIIATDGSKLIILKNTDSISTIIELFSKAIEKSYSSALSPTDRQNVAKKISSELKQSGIENKILNFKEGLVQEGSYPNYDAVIPKDNPIKRKVNVKEWLSQLNGLAETKKFFDKPIAVRIKIGEQDFAFNSELMRDVFQVMAEQGVTEVELQLSQPNRALVVESNKGVMGLVMPFIGGEEYRGGLKTLHKSEMTIAEKNGVVQKEIDYLESRKKDKQNDLKEAISEVRNAKNNKDLSSANFSVEYAKKRIAEIDAEIAEKKSQLIDNPLQEKQDLEIVKKSINNGEITSQEATEYVAKPTKRTRKAKQSIEVVESKAESGSETELNEAIKEADGLISGEIEEVKAPVKPKTNSGIQAQYRIESGKNIIEAIKDFNQSKNKARATVALTHEIMHPTVVSIIDGAKEGNVVGQKHTKTIVEEYNKANPDNKVTEEELIADNDKFVNGETTDKYRAVQEFIAEQWERYHQEGAKGFSKSFQEVLDAISEAFRSVYKSLTGKELTPELRQMFDEILGKEISPPNTNETTPTKEGVSSNVGTFSGESNSIKYQIEENRDEPLSSVNPALAEHIRQRMQRLFPSVALFSDKASFEAAAKKVSKGVTFSSAYIGAAIKNLVYVDAEKALQHTEIHEYAHIYWDALPADHPLKTALLDKFGGNEEAAIDAIGRAGTIIMENELDIAKSGFFEKWLKRFWAAVKGVFTSKSIEQAFAERLLTNADEVTEENITSGVVKYMKMKSSAKYSELSEKAVKGIEKIIGKKISSLTFPEYYKHISTEIKPNDFKQWKMLSPQKFLEKMYGIVSPVSTLSPSNKAVFMKQYREYLDDYNWAENNVWTRFASGSMTLTVKEIEDLYMEAYKRKSYGTKDAVNFLADLYSKAVMYKNMHQEIKGDTFNKPFAKISFDMMSGHEITDLSGSEFVSGKYSLLSPDRVKETILQGREKLYREVQRNATIKEDALKNDFDAIWKRVKDLKSDLRKIVDKTGTYFIDRNSSAYKALRGGTAADRALADLLDMHYKYESAYGGLSMEKGKYRVPVARMDFGGLAKKFGFKEGMRRYFAKPSKYDNVIIDVRSLGLSKPLMTLKQARQEMVKGSNAIYPFQMLKLTKKVDALTKEAYKQFNSGRHANGDIVTTEDLSGSRYGVSFVKDDESSEDLKVSMMLYHYANIENESYDLLSPYSMYIQKYLGRKDKPNMLKWVKMLDDDLIKGESPTSNLGVYAKYVQALTNYTHWLQLGFNIAGMPFNAFAGFAQSVREIGFRNTLRGLRRVIGSLTVGGGAGVVNAKAISIMEKLHIVSLSKDLEMSVTSKIGKGISKIAFLPVSFVEYINHAYSFIGAMDDAEWERLKALPANASAEDYTKAMGGNERVDELHTLTQKINGAYSKYSRRGINKTAEGRALMQFKNWLPDVIFAHLTVSQLNEAGEDLYGEYQSGIATSIKNTVWNKTIIPMFKDKSIAQAKKNWETLSEHEQMQVGKAMRQLVILGGMALWIASLDDRDDKELKRMLKRAMGDVTYIFDVSNMQFLFDNTVPVFGTIKNLLGLVAEVFSTATGNPSVYEKRQGSHMRGDLKLPVMIENQTPVVNKISKLVNEGD